MKSHRRLQPLLIVAALLAALLAPSGVSATTKQVALTFDDGDSELHIRQAVAVAVSTQTPITFFPTGRSLRRFPNLWKAIGDAGIPIANHTVNHPSLTARYAVKGAAGVRSELQGFINLARSLNIPVVPYWRPPGGAWNTNVLNVAKSLGLTLSMWTTTFADTAPMCKNRTIVSYTKATSIPTMVKGTPHTIDWAKAALAVSAPAVRATGPRVPTSLPVPIDHTNSKYTFAQANGITCR
jgi:peptidoglycan/xylan/chitin deacetylase (PgdA/CDA1 family)